MSHYLQVLYRLEVVLYLFFVVCPVCQGNIRKTMRKIGQTDIFSPGGSVLSALSYLEVLSSEMNPAQIRLIRKVVIKERGAAAF
jgi:hypothetical protein